MVKYIQSIMEVYLKVKIKKAAQSAEFQRDPFFKRVGLNIADWFVTKAKRIKTRFLEYIKSKETHKLWKRRLIVIGVILLIVASFRVKEYFKLYPYDEDSYLIVNSDRTTITNYSGESSAAYDRLSRFIKNINARQSDAIRFATNVSGYTVVEDLEYDGKRNVITLTVDNTKNKLVDMDQRKKITTEYNSCVTEVTTNAMRYYKLLGDDDVVYILAIQSLK